MTNYWMNVDIRTKNCRLHKASCRWAQGKYATALKGVRELRQDGGWLEFKSEQSSEKFFQKNYGSHRGYVYAKCKECF